MKRPLAVMVTGWLFIAAGTIGFIYHASELNMHEPFSNDAVWVLLIRLLAIGAGGLILRGLNAGRWLLLAWIAYHVVLSYFHTVSELVTHMILLIIVIAVLFHPRVAGFFKR
jgi:hypothetical protein